MPRRHIVLLVSAALLTGCGSASTPSPQPAAPLQHTAPKSGGQLRVGVTAGGIGTATEGNANGVTKLPNTKVTGPSHTQQGVGAGATCQNTDIAPTAANLTDVVTATLCLLNGERADAGLAPLTQNSRLAQAAVQHSKDMVDQQYFDHVDKAGHDPVDRIRSTGYIPSTGEWTVGENLAWGTGDLATPKEIVSAWMHSTGHRENILRPAFKQIGFGVAVGNPRTPDGQGATYTTTFGGITGAQAAVHSTRKARRARRSRRARISRRSRQARIARIAKGKSGAKKSTKPSGSN
jgi:uncharacterized protein YkwD